MAFCSDTCIRVGLKIIRNACIKNVGKYQSCRDCKLLMLFQQSRTSKPVVKSRSEMDAFPDLKPWTYKLRSVYYYSRLLHQTYSTISRCTCGGGGWCVLLPPAALLCSTQSSQSSRASIFTSSGPRPTPYGFPQRNYIIQ
eukprot:COSAG05_NODE_1897_length_3873_cov_28.019873_3_plen_140_part_00